MIITFSLHLHAQINRVFAGIEAANFGAINLATPNGQTWVTARAALPGYFTVYDGGSFASMSDAANINGYVKKIGLQAYTFPVGSGTDLRTLTISAPAAPASIATAWIAGDPAGNLDPTAPFAGPHATTAKASDIFSVSTLGQWDWQLVSGSGDGLTVTVSIPDLSDFSTAENLRLVGWDGAKWINLSTVATASGNTENSTLSGTMQAGISAVAVGSIAATFPVQLVSFAVQQQACAAQLRWVTANETNATRFDIEQSVDGVNFTTVGSVPAHGGTVAANYDYLTALPAPLVYYRLKMVTSNEQFNFSRVVDLHSNCDGNNYFTIYPNPVTTSAGTLRVNFTVNYEGKATLRITNALDKQLLVQPLVVMKGANQASLVLRGLTAGNYFITLIDAQGKQLSASQQFLKLQ